MTESEQEKYTEESAASFYDELRRDVAKLPTMRLVYAGFGATFRKLLLLNTQQSEVHFSGDFARVDYLMKENGASLEQQRMVNATRTRLRQRESLSADEMQRYWQHDLKSLALLVSLIYSEPIPADIAARFTAEAARESIGKVQSSVWRMVVERWDESYIYGRIDGAPAYMERVKYMPQSADDKLSMPDRSYLRPLFRQGMQLNLVRPREKDGVVTPEIIVIEPDMLIDVSAVASCFGPCGASPWLYMLSKMGSRPASPAITMGHLASQMLDDEINSPTGEADFADTVARFYGRGAVEILTSGAADNAEEFWAEAKRQLQHIHAAIHTQLPSLLGHFDRSDIMLEPSFFSEMLGLQGRMDMLQLDYSMVLEQKSGKCGFPPIDADTPRQQTSHYVQLLLYMMILRYSFRDEYEKIGRRQAALLMYSKYKNSLISLGYAPALAFEAMKMRNSLAWMERHFALEGFGWIERFNVNRLLTDPHADRFFQQYTRPEAEQLLNTVRLSDETAKAYFYRFMRFVAMEHLLAKIGTPGREDSGFAALWNDALSDKIQAGNILCGLRLVEPSADYEGSVETITLAIEGAIESEATNFREGDIVVLYPYEAGTEPDVRRQIVFRCSISELNASSIVLQLRAPQADKRVLRRNAASLWAVEHDLMESGYTSLYRGIYALLCAPKQRIDLVLGRRQPAVDATRQLNNDYTISGSDFNSLALRIKQSRDLFLVLGPPGSGKTSFALTCALREELSEPNGSVLLMAYTNRAVDEICQKLEQENIDYIRVGSSLSCAEPYRHRLLAEIAQKEAKLSGLRDRIMQCRVMVGTTTALSSRIPLIEMHSFSLAIVDEASQILEPHLLPLLAAQADGRSAIGRFVLIGDHKQLPAVVKQSREESLVVDELLHNIGLTDCRESIFQRFYRLWGANPECAAMLTRQGRMHIDIMSFPAREYYEGRLQVAPLPRLTAVLPISNEDKASIAERLFSLRMAFVDVNESEEATSDKVNLPEATLIAHIAHSVYTHRQKDFDPQLTLGVIVPYRNQISAVRRQIQTLYPNDLPLAEISIDTVERYQGSQRDFIVYGTTISQYYQLSFLTDTCFLDTSGALVDRKLNVAMTRAREHLYIVGCAALLHHAASYARLIDYCKEKGLYFG